MENIDKNTNKEELLKNNIEKASRKINKTGTEKKYLIKTYGCQMNEHDSEKIAWILEGMGYIPTPIEEKADFILFNTCAIRKAAEDKVIGQLGEMKRLKRKNPDMILAVCGCMTQREEMAELLTSKYRHVDIIFGTNNIQKLPQLINRFFETQKTVVDILEEHREVDETVEANRIYDYKAYVNIMYGCNNFCSYCIVPYTRGREISREPENILDEIKDLAKNGTKEITLLGQNVNSYGKSLDKEYTFTNLLYDIDKIEGIQRIRFMTSHPKDISDELINAFGELEHLCPQLHLPIQAGSNKVLKEMNRKYTREDYLEKVKKVRKVNPDIVLSTDLMIGFPGETEEDFQDTLDLIREVKFDAAFTFLYSMRDGTPAADRDDQVPDDVKHDRFQRLLDTLNPIALKENQKMVGQTVKVLVEDESKTDSSIMTGRDEGSKIVNFPGTLDLVGQIVDVYIEEAKTFTLEGHMVK